jgi:DNA polymerase-3 subunit gamma/tau
MAYRVLARRYRSQGFDDVVGQAPIATTLRNAITANRVAHGYLFCGTRGVGKTSMARILAKALNCLNHDAPTTEPCGECDVCTAVAEGEDVDVLEIDGASNNSVDNIRDLRSNVIYRPTRARYKVYIIDEVHMLSTGAFNALLKTLEEPPEHVKFIFATTEPQKVPATILSRCQRFDFRSISVEMIGERIDSIVESEGAKADPEVVRRIARMANGSMRDGLSILDQLMSLGENELTTGLLDDVMPTTRIEQIEKLVERLSDSDAAGALQAVEEALNQGLSFELFCELLIDYFRTLMLLAVCGPDNDLVDAGGDGREAIVEQSHKFDAAAYVYMITVVEELRRAVRFSGSGRALIDAAIVRLSQTQNFADIEQLLARLDSVDGGAVSGPAAESAAAKKKSEFAPALNEPPAPASAEVPERPAREPPPVRRSSRPDREQLESAMREPIVKKALALFDGTLMEVVKIGESDGMDST